VKRSEGRSLSQLQNGFHSTHLHTTASTTSLLPLLCVSLLFGACVPPAAAEVVHP
jgi:hypothetical protein